MREETNERKLELNEEKATNLRKNKKKTKKKKNRAIDQTKQNQEKPK